MTEPRTDDSLDTRERILREASKLFAARGYYGTATRDIAAAVGIRQPSLFHHFPSKKAIFQELLSYSVDQAAESASRWATAPGSPAARLYRYLIADVAYLLNAPYDLRGIHNDDVLRLEEFEPWRRTREALHAATAEMIQQGIDAGEFADIDVTFARQAVTGLLLETIRQRSVADARSVEDRPAQTALFVLRALLAVPDRIGDLPRAAAGLTSDDPRSVAG